MQMFGMVLRPKNPANYLKYFMMLRYAIDHQFHIFAGTNNQLLLIISLFHEIFSITDTETRLKIKVGYAEVLSPLSFTPLSFTAQLGYRH